MFLSLCVLLTLASYGFSGVRSSADRDADDYPHAYAARSLSAGYADNYSLQRADLMAPIETVNEGMDKVVALAAAMAKGTTPVNTRSGEFLASAKPEVLANIEKALQEARDFEKKLQAAQDSEKKLQKAS